MDATALAAAIAGGHLTCAQAMEAALAAEAALRRLGSVCRLEPTLGRAAAKAADRSAPAARGPLHGVPFLGKDLGSFAAGLRPAAGSPALRLRLADPGEDSALFARFRAAGLVPFGLTTVPEFGLALTSEPPGGPVACNPWNDALSPGGSSGGAAAAVAAGIVALAHATDAAGSIRVPAACCGLVGLKPSRGVIPGGPDFGNHLMGIASELVLARSVRDVALVFAAVCGDGADPAVSQVALAVPGRAGAAQQTAARAAALALAGAGVSVRSIAAPDGLGAETAALARLILSVSLAEWLDALGVGADEISPLATAVAAEGRALPATALFVASRQMAVLGDRVQRMFDGVQAVLSPVLSGPPPRIGHFDPARADPAAHFAAMEALAPNAALANVAGCPALVLPFGTDAAGLPVGVQLMGPVGSDRALLALAARLEALAPPLVFPYPIAGLA